MKDIIERLNHDEVVDIDSAEEMNKLYDYMVDNDIDPNNYRRSGKSIWLA